MIISANWQVPAHVKAYCSTRQQGYSAAPYDSLNLGTHVGDDPQTVAKNRAALKKHVDLPAEPQWLEQTHSTCACDLDTACEPGSYDASYSCEKNTVCAVLTADCLPLLVCDAQGTQVAAIHAGWRGLLGGVIENTLNQAQFQPANTRVWLGPAISAQAFEVGAEVKEAFIQHQPVHKNAFITGKDKAHFYADLYLLAKQRLHDWGMDLAHISGGDYCTYQQKDLFFSYRRDGQTGRIASLIYLS